MKFDDFLSENLGEIGRYQKRLFFLLCLPAFIVVAQALSWTFAAVQIPYRCALEDEIKNSPYYTNDSRLKFAKCLLDSDETPVDTALYGKDGITCLYDECHLSNDSAAPQCDLHIFDHTKVTLSAIEEWELTCDRGWIKATIQAAYYAGQLFGSIIFGILGDKKRAYFIALVQQAVLGIVIAFSPWWQLYGFIRLLIGLCHPGIFLTTVILGVEFVGPKYRRLATVINGIMWAIGEIILGFEAMLVTDYRWLHIVIAAPALLFLSYWWLIPESARWLVSKRRYHEADKVLQSAARINKVNLPKRWWEQIDAIADEQINTNEVENKNINKYSALGLFRTPEIRKRISVQLFLWIGRKALLAGSYALAGSCLILNWVLGEFELDANSMALQIVQMMITKGSITAAFTAIYTYTPELFPTPIRNTALGMCSTVARFGAIAASYIAMWIAEKFGKVYMIIPFGMMSMLAAILTVVFLPETQGKHLPDTIEEIEITIPTRNNLQNTSKSMNVHNHQFIMRVFAILLVVALTLSAVLAHDRYGVERRHHEHDWERGSHSHSHEHRHHRHHHFGDKSHSHSHSHSHEHKHDHFKYTPNKAY